MPELTTVGVAKIFLNMRFMNEMSLPKHWTALVALGGDIPLAHVLQTPAPAPLQVPGEDNDWG